MAWQLKHLLPRGVAALAAISLLIAPVNVKRGGASQSEPPTETQQAEAESLSPVPLALPPSLGGPWLQQVTSAVAEAPSPHEDVYIEGAWLSLQERLSQHGLTQDDGRLGAQNMLSDLTVALYVSSTASEPNEAFNGELITYTLVATNSNLGTQSGWQLRLIALMPVDVDNKPVLREITCATTITCTRVIISTPLPDPLGGTVIVTNVSELRWLMPLPGAGASASVTFTGRIMGQADGNTFTTFAVANYIDNFNDETAGGNTSRLVTARVRLTDAPVSEFATWLSSDIGGTIRQDWGDYNQDGLLDLALASLVGVSVYRNNGTQLVRAWQTNHPAYSVAWADVDRDNVLDLVAAGDSVTVTEIVSDTIVQDRVVGVGYVYTPTTPSSFGIAQAFTTTYPLARLALADVDNDGFVDIIGSTTFMNAACPLLLLRNVSGVITTTEQCLSLDPATAIAPADVDNDGDVDIAISVFSDKLIVLINDGSGGFNTSLAIEEGLEFLPYDLSWGDYNGDGFLDLAAAFPARRELRVYDNLNGTAFSLAHVLRSQVFLAPLSAQWADFDLDGKLDLVMGDRPPSVWRFDGAQFARLQPIHPNAMRGQLWDVRVVRPFFHDEPLFVTTDRDGPSAYFSTRASRLSRHAALLQNAGGDDFRAFSIAIGDYTNNGLPDIATGAGSAAIIGTRIFHNQQGTFHESNRTSLPAAGQGAHHLAMGDINADGLLDLLIGSTLGVQLFLNGSTPPTGWTPSLPTINGQRLVALADANDDGRLDALVAIRHATQGRAWLFLNTGTNLSNTPSYTFPLIANITAIGWGDFNFDRYPDAAIGTTSGSVYVFRNARDGTFSQVWQQSGLGGPISLDWADFNADSRADLAVGVLNGHVRLFESITTSLHMTPSWNSALVLTTPMNTRAIAWGDWNDDGYPELAVANDNQQDLVFANLGSKPNRARFSLQWASVEISSSRSIGWTDLDGDGDRDLAVGLNEPAGAVALYHNQTVRPSHWSNFFSPTLTRPRNSSYLSVSRPGQTRYGERFSSSEVLAGPGKPTITITYQLYDPDGGRAPVGSNLTGTTAISTVFEYSLDNGSTWRRATPHASSPPPPTQTKRLGVSGLFVWNAQADQAISAQARFRVRVIPLAAHGGSARGSASAISPPFIVRATTCTWPFNVTMQIISRTTPLITTTNPAVGQVITLTASALGGPGSIYYHWNLGDGSPPRMGQVITHTYTSPGWRNVRLTVFGDPCPITREAIVNQQVLVGPYAHWLYLPITRR